MSLQTILEKIEIPKGAQVVMSVSVPPALKEELVEAARQKDVSLSKLVVAILREAMR